MDSLNYLLVWILTVLCVTRICDSSTANKRIFNGTTVSITDYPYAVPILIAVYFDVRNVTPYDCGGAIISNRWVISAAHCYKLCRTNACHVALRTGTNFLNRQGIRHICDLALMHSQYLRDARGSHNDIGLLRGVHSFLIGLIAKSIPFAKKPPTNGTFAISLGWANVTKCDDNATEYLRSIEMEILDSVRCQELVKSSRTKIDEGMLCAGATPRKKGMTRGDSGGPLVLNGTLVGVLSMATPCDFNQFPDVFVNVSHYYNWIQKNTLSNSTQQVGTLGNSTQQVVPVAKLPHCFKFKTN